MRHFKVLIVTLVVVGVSALGSDAFARMGQRAGQGGMGMGHGMGMGSGMGPGNLTPEELKLFQDERAAFMKETQTLRQGLYQKNLELRSELAKAKPDAARAAKIQKEISSTRASLDQKRLDHMLKLNKIKPGLGGMGGGMGSGMGMMKHGMGRGMMGGGRMGGTPPCLPAQ